jgi:hypothetical protein
MRIVHSPSRNPEHASVAERTGMDRETVVQLACDWARTNGIPWPAGDATVAESGSNLTPDELDGSETTEPDGKKLTPVSAPIKDRRTPRRYQSEAA